MTTYEIKNMTTSEIDHRVVIKGTKFDRQRKVSSQMASDMIMRYVLGESVSSIAKRFDVSPSTVLRHVSQEYYEKRKKDGGKNPYRPTTARDRGEYKRGLLMAGADVIIRK